MNGNVVVLDTNIVLYILGNKYNLEKLPEGRYCISFITEMELLSYQFENADDEKEVKDFINSIDIIEMNEGIKILAIDLRRNYKIKLPDAIICATALFEKGILVSGDKELKDKIKEIKIIN